MHNTVTKNSCWAKARWEGAEIIPRSTLNAGLLTDCVDALTMKHWRVALAQPAMPRLAMTGLP